MLARYMLCVVCPSVRPSVRHKPVLYRNDLTDRGGFGTGASFDLHHTVLEGNSDNFKNTGILLSGSLSQTRDLENFAVASRWLCQQNSSTVELVDRTYANRRVVAGRTYSLSQVGRL